MKWYPQVNDVVGGWIVSTLDMPYSAHDNRSDRAIAESEIPAGPRGYVIAECMTREDAVFVAGLLTMEDYQPPAWPWEHRP